MLRLVAGRYETELVPTNLQGFTQDLIRGRDMEHDCPQGTVELDPMVCNVVLDNAVTNAKRHGCARDPRVKLTVKVTPEDGEHLDTDAPVEARVRVRFLVSNRANPHSNPLVIAVRGLQDLRGFAQRPVAPHIGPPTHRFGRKGERHDG